MTTNIFLDVYQRAVAGDLGSDGAYDMAEIYSEAGDWFMAKQWTEVAHRLANEKWLTMEQNS